MTIRKTSITRIQGAQALVVSVSPSREMPLATYRFSPTGGVAHADLHVDGHQHAEVDRVDAELHGHREEDRRQDQDDRGGLHDVAGQQQQHVGDQIRKVTTPRLWPRIQSAMIWGICSWVIRKENSTALVMM